MTEDGNSTVIFDQTQRNKISYKYSNVVYDIMTKPGRVTIAGHPGDDIAIGTLNSILKQAQLKER